MLSVELFRQHRPEAAGAAANGEQPRRGDADLPRGVECVSLSTDIGPKGNIVQPNPASWFSMAAQFDRGTICQRVFEVRLPRDSTQLTKRAIRFSHGSKDVDVMKTGRRPP